MIILHYNISSVESLRHVNVKSDEHEITATKQTIL